MGRIEDVHTIVMHMICYYFMDAEKPAAVPASASAVKHG
jgi:hypothetical protein